MRNEFVLPTIPDSSIHLGGDDTPRQTNFVCDWHLHDEWELLWVRNGEKTFLVGDDSYHLEKDDIIFIGSQIPHEVRAPAGCVDFLVQFQWEDHLGEQEAQLRKMLTRFLNMGGDSVRVFRVGETEQAVLLQLIKNIFFEREACEKGYEIFIKSYVYQLLANLIRMDAVPNPRAEFYTKQMNRLMPVFQYIDVHYRETITLDTLSALVGFDRSYFCRLFRKTTNTSVMQYLNIVRVYHAERMLKTTDCTVSQAALESGFSSVAYFNRIFKRYRFCSPSFYKKIKN